MIKHCLLALLGFIATASTAPTHAAALDMDAPRANLRSDAVHGAPLAPSLAELRRGGYVFYFRHTSTDFSQDDTKSHSFDDCANQRNLTEGGRDEARAIGKAVRALKIPIGTVYASPYCRTMETARLAFGRAQATNEVRGGPVAADDPARYAALRRLLGTPQARGTNVVIASHGNPFYAVAGAPYLAEGEAAIVRGLGGESFEVVGRIRLDGWRALSPGKL